MKCAVFLIISLSLTGASGAYAAKLGAALPRTFKKPSHIHGKVWAEWNRWFAASHLPASVMSGMMASFMGRKEPPALVNPNWKSHTIDVYRYHGSFEFATHLRLKRLTEGPFPGRFVPDFAGTMSLHEGYRMMEVTNHARFLADPLQWLLASRQLRGDRTPVRSLLEMQQEFPIAEMLRRGLVDERSAAEMLKAESWLEPSQVSFFSVSETVAADVLRKAFGEIPKDAEVMEDRIHYRLKRASAWLITGHNHLGARLTVPAEKLGLKLVANERWKLPEQPLFWELGRSAQTTPFAFHEAAKQALLQVYRELHAMGADPKRAVIVASAFDQAHAEVFEGYGMKEVDRTADGKRLFAASFEDLVKTAELTTASEPLSTALLAVPEWDVSDAMEFLNTAKSVRSGGFILRRPKGGTVSVGLRDFTTAMTADLPGLQGAQFPVWFPYFYKRYGREMREADSPPGLADTLYGQATENPFFSRFHDDFPAMMRLPDNRRGAPAELGRPWRDFVTEANAIEVHVEGDDVTKRETEMAAVHALRRARAVLREGGLTDPDADLRRSGVHFAIGTSDRRVGKAWQESPATENDGHYAWARPYRDAATGGVIYIGLWGTALSLDHVLRLEASFVKAGDMLPIEETEARFYNGKISTY